MFAVIRQREVSESSRGWAEWDDSGYYVAHKTKAGAEAALKTMVPEGVDAWQYAGLRVEEIDPSLAAYAIIIE